MRTMERRNSMRRNKPETIRLMNLFSVPVWERIQKTCVTSDQHLHMGCLEWLSRNGLTMHASPMQQHVTTLPPNFQRLKRCSRLKDADMKKVREEAKKQGAYSQNGHQVWQELKQPDALIAALDQRLIPDCMAFYQPFHVEPTHEWGIYLSADELFRHASAMYEQLRGKIVSFPLDVLLSLVVFEVFHHEFFHHIVESAVTTLESLSLSKAELKPLYKQYCTGPYCHHATPDSHPHHPLEEALANAYAYNSLSFLTRVKLGYKPLTVKAYQKALLSAWRRFPPGYCDAEHYIDRQQASGTAQLLSMILDYGHLDPSSAMLVSRGVLLNGNSAFYAKPDIPTYIYGTQKGLENFEAIIPAPNETYTTLFWARDTAAIDKTIQAEDAKEKKQKEEKREAARAARKQKKEAE